MRVAVMVQNTFQLQQYFREQTFECMKLVPGVDIILGDKWFTHSAVQNFFLVHRPVRCTSVSLTGAPRCPSQSKRSHRPGNVFLRGLNCTLVLSSFRTR
jgi:hypothetical protein